MILEAVEFFPNHDGNFGKSIYSPTIVEGYTLDKNPKEGIKDHYYSLLIFLDITSPSAINSAAFAILLILLWFDKM